MWAQPCPWLRLPITVKHISLLEYNHYTILNMKCCGKYLGREVITYSMLQSPSWEANWFAASQEIPRISRNPKVHYRTHKRPPPVSILGQPNPVRKPTSHLLEIHPNIIHLSTPRSPQWSPSLRFPHQDPIHPPPHPYAPHSQPISFFSILSPAQYWVRSTSHLAPRYAISSIPPLGKGRNRIGNCADREALWWNYN